jgi:hypothetical protein
MKGLLFSFIVISIIMIVSCKKDNNHSSNLTLIQHTWMVVSENGEALHYAGTPGDYFDFAPDNKLYRYVDKIYDTSAYTLLPDGRTLSVFPILHGVESATPMNFNIKSLTGTDLILYYSSGIIFSLDSLKR